DRVETRLRAREHRPAVDLRVHGRIRALGELGVERLLVLRLREADCSRLPVHRQHGQVELGADRRRQAVRVDALAREARADLGEQLLLDRELVEDGLGVLDLVGAEVGVDRHEGDRVRGNEPRGVPRRRSASASAAAACSEQRNDSDACETHSHRFRSYSSVGRLPIKPAASSWIGLPSSTEQTPSVIGSSTPILCERSRSTGAVVRASTTWPISAFASSAVAPPAIRAPARRLRPLGWKQVAIRSPMPASPANVSGVAPAASPSLAISTSPRVIRAAFALSPSPRPSTAPAASAITFFAAPHSSTPVTSPFT